MKVLSDFAALLTMTSERGEMAKVELVSTWSSFLLSTTHLTWHLVELNEIRDPCYGGHRLEDF